MARLADIVFDCARPAALARFWAAALDDYEVAPYDDEELERLRSIGIDDVEDDPSVLVQATPDRPPAVVPASARTEASQEPGPPRPARRRAEVELARLTAMGATVADDQPVADLVVMRDPEGNEFCLLRP